MNLIKRPFFGPAAAIVTLLVLVVADGWYEMKPAFAFTQSSVPMPISQTPLAISTPAHPQVLILLGNSQSVDGDLSGAINTGSGALAVGDATLANSSSPTSYTVPSGFTPPINAGTGGVAPYTVNTGGTLYDNSASRLNVAKGGIAAILNSYTQNTDFGLEVYNPNATSFSTYTTWVYYMSPNGGFTFTNTATDLGTGNATETVPNPCYNYQAVTTSVNVKANCLAIAGNTTLNYGANTLNTSLYMRVLASSDDATINDVLYSGPTNDLFVDYNTNNGNPSPASPYTGSFCGTSGLPAYESGCILESYTTDVPYNGVTATSPTNAGYVPFSTQVMYALRGFGYYAPASATNGTVLVSLAQGNAGASPTTASVNAAIGHFTPYLAPETNNGSSAEIKALAVQSPLAGLLTTAKTTLAAAASSGVCNQKQYVILITDGLPTEDTSGKSWPPLGSVSAAGYGVTATFTGTNGAYNGNDQALLDTIAAITNLQAAGVNTYVVGIGAGVDPTNYPIAAKSLTAMAVAGGTGTYIAATSPTALTDGLGNILSAIQAGTAASTSVAVSSTSLSSTEYEFQATFNPNTSPYSDWTGDLTASTINATTLGPNTPPVWDAQALLDSQVGSGGYNTRAIATWNPSPPATGTPPKVVPAGVPFQWASLNATQQAQLQATPDTLGSNRVLYLRGDTALEQRNGGVFRNRTHILGDIVDSQPLLVQTGSATSPTQMLYVGANDGMLHAFNAATGAEVFAFVPNGVMSNLYLLSAPLYNQGHHFYVDGSPNSAVVQFADNSSHTIVVGGENAGGRTIYALDVTNPLSMTTDAAVASKVLWEFSDTDLGDTYSQPQIATINPGTPDMATTPAYPGSAVIFGNGYDSSSNSDMLYFVNPQTGSLITKINLCTSVVNTTNPCLSGYANGLSTISYGQKDGLQNQPITTVYVGDLQGNMWAIDVSAPSPASWTVRLLFQTQRTGTNPTPTGFQPITTAPVVTLNPAYPSLPGLFVMFGTGQLLQANDLTNNTPQSVYGLYDRPVTSASASPVLVTPGNSGTAKYTLVAQTLSVVTAAQAAAEGLNGPLLLDTSNPVNLNSVSGWYDNLLAGSQEVITNPILYNGGFVTSLNTPPGSNCGGTFSSSFLDLNYATGGAFSSPQFDDNGSGTVTSADNYTTTNPNGTTSSSSPVGMSLNPTTSASGPSIIGLKVGKQVDFGVTSGGGTPRGIVGANGAPIRASWWQIQ